VPDQSGAKLMMFIVTVKVVVMVYIPPGAATELLSATVALIV